MIPEWMIWRIEELRKKSMCIAPKQRPKDVRLSVSNRYYRAWELKSYWGESKKVGDR